jgi:hypothetical protein
MVACGVTSATFRRPAFTVRPILTPDAEGRLPPGAGADAIVPHPQRARRGPRQSCQARQAADIVDLGGFSYRTCNPLPSGRRSTGNGFSRKEDFSLYDLETSYP